MNERILTFLHSGACGDVIASLSIVKEICERESARALLILDPTGGMKCNDPELNRLITMQTQELGYKFSEGQINFIKPLIEFQPYIAKVELWNEALQVQIDYNLNKMRYMLQDREVLSRTNQNIEFLYQAAFGLKERYNAPWLFVDEPKQFGKDILIARSTRYQSAHLWFAIRFKQLKDNSAFIGTKFEHEVFENAILFRPDFLDCKNSALEAARYIAGSKLFIANGTLLYWIGVGLGHPQIINEMGVDIPTTYYKNSKNISFIQGGKIFK